MNERIKLLAIQAGATVCGGYTSHAAGSWSDTGDIDSRTLDVEKFAELIVRECLDIASEVRGEPATDTHYVIGYDRACEKMISGIKEHFGVEE